MARSSRRRGPYIALGIFVLLVAAAGAVAVTVKTSKANLTADSTALAKVAMPVGGGTIQTVSVTDARTNQQIPAQVSGGQIWPSKLIPAHELVSIYVVVKRPSSVAWLTGKTEQLHLTLMTPSAHLLAHFLTVPDGQPLHLQFADPCRRRLHRAVADQPASPAVLRHESVVTLPRNALAGSIYVAAAPRTWESSSASLVSWFPAGASTSAIAYPSPGTTIKADTPITLTFNKPVSQVLHGSMPDVSPQSQGTWRRNRARMRSSSRPRTSATASAPP